MVRNDELVQVAKKAADAWRNTDAYHQAAQIIDMLVEELEGDTLTQPNEPLTLEELREMNGEPVWVEELNRWVLVDLMYARGNELVMVLFGDGDIEVRNVELYNLHCYRRPPEGEEEEKHVIEITENL